MSAVQNTCWHFWASVFLVVSIFVSLKQLKVIMNFQKSLIFLEKDQEDYVPQFGIIYDLFSRDETLVIFRRVHPKPIRFAASKESHLDRDCQIPQWHWSRSLHTSLWSADHSVSQPHLASFPDTSGVTHTSFRLSLIADSVPFCAWGVSQSPLT